jgi:integrase/recombinase XerD
MIAAVVSAGIRRFKSLHNKRSPFNYDESSFGSHQKKHAFPGAAPAPLSVESAVFLKKRGRGIGQATVVSFGITSFKPQTTMSNDNFQVVLRPSSLGGEPLLTSSTSNSELIGEYIAWKESYTSTAYRAYRLWATRFQEFVNKPPESVLHTDYIAFARSLQGRYASRCIEFALNIVHNYLRFFAEQGRLRFPLYLARVPRGYSNSHPAITEGEYRRLVESMRTVQPLPLRDLAIVMLLHDTGMRIGELLSLEIEDIQEDCSAVVRTEKTVRRRRVFWNADTDLVLQQYLVERVNHGPSELDALFVVNSPRTKKALSARTVERIVTEGMARIGVRRGLCPHSFRHAFIHRLAKLGVPDAIIAQLVGHGTPHSISHYTALSRPEFKDYAQKQLQFAVEQQDLPYLAAAA